jgi:hypothetical protein
MSHMDFCRTDNLNINVKSCGASCNVCGEEQLSLFARAAGVDVFQVPKLSLLN